MIYHIIFLIILILILIFLHCYNFSLKQNLVKNEDFFNYKTNFEDTENLLGLVNSPDNFKSVKMLNPGDTSYVLCQETYSNNPFTISIEVDKNTYYSLTYWRTNDNLYNGGEKDIIVSHNNNQLDVKSQLIETKNVGEYVWKKIRIEFLSLGSKISLELGNIGKFTSGKRFLADIQVDKYYPELSDFDYHNNLKSFFLFSSVKSINSKDYKDKALTTDIIFDNVLKSDIQGVHLDKTKGLLGVSSDLLNQDHFSIIFTYYPIENESGSILNFHANNDINKGVNIDIQSTVGVDNRLSLTIVDKNYIYNIGLIHSAINFILIITKKVPKLFINGSLQKPVKQTNVNTISLGTCPDGWKLEGTTCTAINNNLGTCDQKTYDVNNNDKSNWANSCGISWTNCKQLSDGEIAPNNNESCDIDLDLDFSNKKAVINKNKSLTGILHNLIIYNNELSNDDSIGIYKYLVGSMLGIKSKNICDKEIENVVNVNKKFTNTSLLNNNSNNEFKDNTDFNNCPFDNDKICKNTDCECVDWSNVSNLNNISDDCKKTINQYCLNNYSDQYCNKLRINKCKKKKISNEKNSTVTPNLNKENVELSIDNNLKDRIEAPSINKVRDCSACKSEVDLSKYIRKDQIPCWGCNLEKIDNV